MYDKNNLFAKIISNEIKANKFYEDDEVIAFHDIDPIAEIHILVIPKGDYINYYDFVKRATQKQCLHFFQTLNVIVEKLHIEDSFRLISNNGSGQSVQHFHVHIISGKILKETDIIQTN